MKSSKIIISKIIKKIIVLVIILFAIYNTVYVLGKELNKTFNIKLFGKEALKVNETSMEPEFKKNDIVLVDTNEAIKEDDVIAFYKNGQVILKRVIKINDLDGKKEYLTKGDNNLYLDPDTLSDTDIQGKVIKKIEHFKWVLKILRSKWFMVFITLLFVVAVRNNQLKKRKETRRRKLKEQYEQNDKK